LYSSVDVALQAPQGRSNRVAKLLDYIMLKRPDDDFIKLKKAIIELGQVHVVKYLEPCAIDHTDQAVEWASTGETRSTDFSCHYVRGWKALIVNNRTDLVDDLVVDDGLVGELIKFGVINVTFSEILKVMSVAIWKYRVKYKVIDCAYHIACSA